MGCLPYEILPWEIIAPLKYNLKGHGKHGLDL